MIKLLIVLIILCIFIIAELHQSILTKKSITPKNKANNKEKMIIKNTLNHNQYQLDKESSNKYRLSINEDGRQIYLLDFFIESYLKFNGKKIKLDITKDLDENKNIEVFVKEPTNKPKIYLPGIEDDKGDHYE